VVLRLGGGAKAQLAKTGEADNPGVYCLRTQDESITASLVSRGRLVEFASDDGAMTSAPSGPWTFQRLASGSPTGPEYNIGSMTCTAAGTITFELEEGAAL
jgi:hypothetical protein